MDLSDTTIHLTETLTPFANFQLADITLWLGDPPENIREYSAIQIGEEGIVIITNPTNPIANIRKENVGEIYTGRITNWGFLEDGYGSINVWLYPKGDPTRRIFERNYLGQLPVTSLARIAPDPLAMINAIASDTSGIGYIPDSWLDSKLVNESLQVNVQTLRSNISDGLQQPVLALTSVEPQGTIHSLLYCLQITGEIVP
jgi:phosphate transport system substrate-binding protein